MKQMEDAEMKNAIPFRLICFSKTALYDIRKGPSRRTITAKVT
jgi:hypothetical protein